VYQLRPYLAQGTDIQRPAVPHGISGEPPARTSLMRHALSRGVAWFISEVGHRFDGKVE
jgi:hypothetical protein